MVNRLEGRRIGQEVLDPDCDTQIAGAAGAAFFANGLYQQPQQ